MQLNQGGMLRQKKTAKFLTEIFLSDKIIRKTKIFPVFWEIFPVFAVLTLLPGKKLDGIFVQFKIKML